MPRTRNTSAQDPAPRDPEPEGQTSPSRSSATVPEEAARTLMRQLRATYGEASEAARGTRAILELLGTGEGMDAAEVILTLIEALAEQRTMLCQIADRLDRIEARLAAPD